MSTRRPVVIEGRRPGSGGGVLLMFITGGTVGCTVGRREGTGVSIGADLASMGAGDAGLGAGGAGLGAAPAAAELTTPCASTAATACCLALAYCRMASLMR